MFSSNVVNNGCSVFVANFPREVLIEHVGEYSETLRIWQKNNVNRRIYGELFPCFSLTLHAFGASVASDVLTTYIH